jgi:hypothetical protein
MIHRSSPILWKDVLGVKLLGTLLDPPFDIVLAVAATIRLNGVAKILAIPDGIAAVGAWRDRAWPAWPVAYRKNPPF